MNSSHQGTLLRHSLVVDKAHTTDSHSNQFSVTIDDECITKFNDFRMSRGKTKFVIYKITDDKKRVVVEDVSDDADWEVFRTKLADAKDAAGNPAPRYATYDVQFEIPGEGQRYTFPPVGIRWDTTKRDSTGARSSSSHGFPKTLPPA